MKSKKQVPPITVEKVDISRYLGKWYEIARYPNRFQEGCTGSRATYALRQDGKISVINECFDERKSKIRRAKGKAWVIDRDSNAKLKVSFFWPFSGDYWIIDLGNNYEYAVVGHPQRKYLWILSRTMELNQKLTSQIISRLEDQGYNPSLLIWSEQKGMSEGNR